MNSLRRALGQIEPHVSLKAAWKRVIQVSRRLRKDGHPTLLHERAAVERLLNQQLDPSMDLRTLKMALQQLVQASGEESESAQVRAVETWAADWVAEFATGDVEIRIQHPGGFLDERQIDRWLGTANGRTALDAQTASGWVHHLDGLSLGGASVRVEIEIEEGKNLPAVGRTQRARERNHMDLSWLPKVDTEGHYSATPKAVAYRHGSLLSEPKAVVIDPFCGLGADAIASALAGATVVAGDHSATPLELARLNAQHFGVQKRVDFQCRDALTLLEEQLVAHPGATVFLDPPWGGHSYKHCEKVTLYLGKSDMASVCKQMKPHYRYIILKVPINFTFGDDYDGKYKSLRITSRIQLIIIDNKE